jgi:hypothetical protein
MSLLFEPFYYACMGLKVVFENVAMLYTPYIYTIEKKSKTFIQKTLNKKIMFFKDLNPSLEKDPIVMEGGLAK